MCYGALDTMKADFVFTGNQPVTTGQPWVEYVMGGGGNSLHPLYYYCYTFVFVITSFLPFYLIITKTVKNAYCYV